jgi:hypothetical protein
MKLSDLEARLVKITDNSYTFVDSLPEAQGLILLCPGCFRKLGTNVGCHSLILWAAGRGVPDSKLPGPGRWKFDGTSLQDLTLNAMPPNQARSIQVGGCWHGYIDNGDAHD